MAARCPWVIEDATSKNRDQDTVHLGIRAETYLQKVLKTILHLLIYITYVFITYFSGYPSSQRDHKLK